MCDPSRVELECVSESTHIKYSWIFFCFLKKNKIAVNLVQITKKKTQKKTSWWTWMGAHVE